MQKIEPSRSGKPPKCPTRMQELAIRHRQAVQADFRQVKAQAALRAERSEVARLQRAEQEMSCFKYLAGKRKRN